MILTLIWSCSFICNQVTLDVAVGSSRSVPHDLQAVHGDVCEAEIGNRPRQILKSSRVDWHRLGPIASWVEAEHRDDVPGVHVQIQELKHPSRGSHHLSLLGPLWIFLTSIEDFVAQKFTIHFCLCRWLLFTNTKKKNNNNNI